MSLTSDLTIDPSKFDRKLADEQTKQFNEKLIKIWADGPRWYEVGAAEYRKLRWEGKTPLPKPVVLPEGINGTIPSRDTDREIPYRVFKPASGVSKGIHLHIHGGGWVLQSEHYQDTYLKYMADHFELTVFSVGYRLAPEDPWPAGVEDCYDTADWLIKNGQKAFGGALMFTGGESAGAHLACLVAFHLLTHQPAFAFRGLLLHFGCFDLSSFLPHVANHETHLVIDHDVMSKYIAALLPDTTPEQRRDPSISPFFADIRGWKLPPALFTCGSEDPLIDDTVFMGAKWGMWGGEAVVKVYNGAPHGFIGNPPGLIKSTQEGLDDTEAFVKAKMGI
ncbi:alpha/beta-hydrolase [Dothidotthia symphoricarpi CBS 119687]|uniref:Alpha/beta-hydrolase n=1 Tax=Dothidotthia symphoricarpi CBS 119687 TaxID=1392245 RepID=A0A6A6ABG0_9PLEO|nr:alpha/beta-hydrolase [Dothidotthia symphoricarpi CBS 119687]KAF2128354.1 alpha/beta-hydrolase [Dothidotthia symphoricarpi CBS 119687]